MSQLPTAQKEAPKPAELPVQAFQQMEKRDEEQILAERRGELVEEFVYSIMLQGREVTNLSYAGVKEAIRRRGNLEILEIRTEETESEIRALIRVRDLDNRIDVVGASSAEKSKPFSYTLAVNKAERNAFAKLIPAKFYASLIQDWLQKYRAKIPERSIEEPAALPSATQLKVPITKDPLSQTGLRQIPLIRGTFAIGMVNILGNELSIVPEKPIPVDDSALNSFLFSRVLDPMIEKHAELEYHVLEGDGGVLKAVLLRGRLDDGQIKELCNAARWSFEKALERA